MMQERIMQSEQVSEFRALGEQLQLKIEAMVRERASVPPDLFDKYTRTLRDNQTVFDNLSRMTTAAVALNRFLDRMLGMSVEGCLIAMGGSEPTLKTGMWASIALTNQRVRCAIKNADAVLAAIQKNKIKDEVACDDE